MDHAAGRPRPASVRPGPGSERADSIAVKNKGTAQQVLHPSTSWVTSTVCHTFCCLFPLREAGMMGLSSRGAAPRGWNESIKSAIHTQHTRDFVLTIMLSPA